MIRVTLLSVAALGVQGWADDSSARDGRFDRSVEALFPTLVEIRRDIHRNPELSNQEERTAKVVAERLRKLGLEVKTGIGGHGVVALLRGGKEGGVVAVRADMDGLPIQEAGGRPYGSTQAGVMHACGHDVHVTAALGVAELLVKHRDDVKGTVKFIFQPAEEGMPVDFKEDWGALRMLREGALENPKPQAIFALHCTPLATRRGSDRMEPEPLLAGQIGYCLGPSSANSDRFRITIKGKMAHGAAPHRSVDAVVVAAEAVTALQTIRSRATDTQDPLVLTIGSIHGGNRENIIAGEVELRGTVRTYSEKVQDRVIKLMQRTLKGVTDAHGATYELDYRKGYPSILNREEIGNRALKSIERIVGEKNVIDTLPGMGGEDFSYFSRVVPGFYYRLGVANVEKGITAGVHTAEFDVDESCLKVAVKTMAAVVCDALDRP
jgi:amidohydrolase